MSVLTILSMSLAESEPLWHTGVHADCLMTAEQINRFESVNNTPSVPFDRSRGVQAPARYAGGAVLFCDSYMGAVMLAAVHQAHGFDAATFWDMAMAEWVVISSRPLGSGAVA